jgi:hypothetical protein
VQWNEKQKIDWIFSLKLKWNDVPEEIRKPIEGSKLIWD